ncbi:hypothetical protein ACE1AT_04760 [Pelatocladus sp. BLCC-F211]|uniref:hypothetical protein n=1 Tax=Pelatocladus sp. BLCC-F211 TaxID=3342752 RepID=UPI0035BB8ECD
MPRSSSLTVKANRSLETTNQNEPKTITRAKPDETSITAPQAGAVTLQDYQELELVFDEDLRIAIIQRLIQDKALIQREVDEERKIAKALELARLVAVDKAKVEGRQQARAEVLVERKKQKSETQKHFIEIELPQLLETCEYLGYEVMKQTITQLAGRIDVTLEWEEKENGEYECKAIARN